MIPDLDIYRTANLLIQHHRTLLAQAGESVRLDRDPQTASAHPRRPSAVPEPQGLRYDVLLQKERSEASLRPDDRGADL